MTVALQMPIDLGELRQTGPRTFRKQLLTIGEIEHKGRTLRFDRPYLERLVQAFKLPAFDQVPLVLANEQNEHNESPENFRGEIRALELTDDGLDAVVETNDKGVELVRDNPRLGVSARIVEGAGIDGGPAIRHVCATLDPKVRGMRPWETVSLSVRWTPQDGDTVVDLSNSQYVPETKTPTLTDEQLTELQNLKPEERAAKARELLGESAPSSTETEKNDDDKKPRFPGLRKLLGIDAGSSDEDLDAALAKLADGGESTDDDKDKDRERVLASLTAEQREAIDLANTDAAAARRDAAVARAEVAKANWKLERKELADAGVPPAMLDLCAPLFEDGSPQVIDLSNGKKFDSGDVIRKLLAEAKGYVDLSGAAGSDEDSDDVKEAKRLASDEAWEASI